VAADDVRRVDRRDQRDQQVDLLCEVFPTMGYTAPNARVMAERNFVDLGDGRFERRPPRHLFADAFADDGDRDILRMYRQLACSTLLVRCTESGAPPRARHGAGGARRRQLVGSRPPPPAHPPGARLGRIDEIVAEVEGFLGPV